MAFNLVKRSFTKKILKFWETIQTVLLLLVLLIHFVIELLEAKAFYFCYDFALVSWSEVLFKV